MIGKSITLAQIVKVVFGNSVIFKMITCALSSSLFVMVFWSDHNPFDC